MTARLPAQLQPRVYLAGSDEAEATILAASPLRAPLWIIDWNQVGLQWVRSDAGAGGTATIVLYGTCNKNLAEADLDPSTNPWWTELGAADQFATTPAAAAGSDLISLAFHGMEGILAVVTPSATLDNFRLVARLRGMDSR